MGTCSFKTDLKTEIFHSLCLKLIFMPYLALRTTSGSIPGSCPGSGISSNLKYNRKVNEENLNRSKIN